MLGGHSVVPLHDLAWLHRRDQEVQGIVHDVALKLRLAGKPGCMARLEAREQRSRWTHEPR